MPVQVAGQASRVQRDRALLGFVGEEEGTADNSTAVYQGGWWSVPFATGHSRCCLPAQIPAQR